MKDSIKVVFCRPGKTATIEDIGSDLKSMQRAVDGLIQPIRPFHDARDLRIKDVVLVCNEEGKLGGYKPCRLLMWPDGRTADVIFGDFFLCYAQGEALSSLPDDLLQRFRSKFFYPEAIVGA